MRFLPTLSVAVLAAAFTSHARAAEPTIPDGSYLFSYTPNATLENRVAVVKFTTKDKATTGEFVKGASGWTVSDIKVTGSTVTAKVVIGSNNLTFEGLVNPKNSKEILGSMGDDRLMFRAVIVPTELESIETKDARKTTPAGPEMAAVTKLRVEPNRLRAMARQEMDAEKKKELLTKATAAQKEADEKIPALLAKAVDATTGTAAGYFTTLELLAVAEKTKVKADAVSKWASAAIAYAALHGPRFEQIATGKIAEALAGQKAYAEVALNYAGKAVAAAEKGTTAAKVTALKILRRAQESAGKTAEAKATLVKLDKLETVLDEEYKKTVPPFTPTKFAGRTAKDANRVAVMELFTGAQCPPCVAADVAFDALEKAYSPKDLVLIQYHMHIPGPDPLTNLDSIARWDFYRAKFPMGIRGTPSTLFNGKPDAGGGGGMANSKSKFDQYRKLIDPILETTTDIKLGGSAKQTGQSLEVNLSVAGVEEPAADVKVRLLLVEEQIRYVGGNGLRFHHMVVRSQFDMMDGTAVKNLKGGKLTAKVSLDDVRKNLSSYLADFEKSTSFPNPDRPLALKGLKVIALVQNEDTKEILQAIQLDVTGPAS